MRTEDFNSTYIERLLLFIAGAFITLHYALLLYLFERSWQHIFIPIIWIFCAFIGHWSLNYQLPKRDPYLYPIMMLLIGWGLVTIDRVAPLFAQRQTIWLILGTCLAIALFKHKKQIYQLEHYYYHGFIITIILLGTTLFIGVNPSGFGPKLWLGSGNLFFQPSEPLKLFVLIFLAGLLTHYNKTYKKRSRWIKQLIIPSILILGLCIFILVLQGDLGTATIFYVIYILMLYVALEQPIILVIGISLLLLLAYISYQTVDIVKLRIDVWLNPWADADNRAYQIVQSIMAVSAGGFFGVGIGQGQPTFVPVVHTDFIFAAIAEEWGFAGIVVMLFNFGVLIYRSLQLGLNMQSQSIFLALLAIGIGILFATQSLMIMGGIVRLWPITGIPLPFVSYGGSSLLTSITAIAMLLIISNQQSSASSDGCQH